MWALETERGQGTESRQSSSRKTGRRETLSDSRDACASCHLTGQQGCPGDRAPAARGQLLAESRAQGRVARPSFVQLTQAGPSLSPADSEAGSPEVTGQGGTLRARAHKGERGASPGNTSFWKVVSRICQW